MGQPRAARDGRQGRAKTMRAVHMGDDDAAKAEGRNDIADIFVREIEGGRITPELARRSGFDSVTDLLSVAKSAYGLPACSAPI